MATVATSSSYKPVPPLSAEWSSVLSQDVITTATVPVDSTSPAPVGVFTNPSNAQVEALAIVNTGAGKQICHIARDRGTDAGWRVVPLFGGRSAQQVAAAAPYSGTVQSAVYGLFVDDGKLYFTSLGADGSTWSAPAAVTGPAMSNPRVAYSPDGRAVIYGVSPSGDLVTAYQAQVGGPFTSVVCSVKGALSQDDFRLCMTDEQTFTILANYNSAPYLITGVLGADHSSSLGAAPGFDGKIQHAALGYWSSQQNTIIFLLVDGDKALHAWSQNATNTVVQKIPNGSISQATGHVDTDGYLHVYAIDEQQTLWVLHQSARQPWRDDGMPNWAPILALDKGVAHVASDMNPAVVPSLFALDGGDSSLRLHARDATSGMWSSDKVLQHATQAYEVVRYRTEVRIVDGHGRALPNQAVTVAVEKGGSAIEAWAGGSFHQLDENGAILTTDMMGKLTVSVLATDKGLACPNLVVSDGGLTSPVTVKPASGIHTYLSGQGTLNPTNPGGPLPVFDADGGTLQGAKVDGKPLASGATPSAAAAIRNGALIALGNPPPGVTGFGGSLRKGNQTFQVFHTVEALESHRAAANLSQVGDFWDELKHFFGDVFEGICNGVIAIAHFVVDVARAVVDFTLQIADWTAKAVGLPIDGIEKAAAFMNGVFNSVDATIDKVVDWLKALFDFAAIWRTKMAIEQGILAVPLYVKQLALLSQKRADKWFAHQKQSVNDAFAALEKEYAKQSFNAQENWQNPTAPVSSQRIAGGAAPADFTSNPHHNWLLDKVTSHAPEVTAASSGDGPWQAFAAHMSESGQEFLGALGKFKDAVWSIIENPSSFATTAIPDFLEMARLMVDALLDFCDAMVDAIAGLAADAMDALEETLKAELPLGFLNTLWSWIAGLAGYPKDDKLTLSALGSLLMAFPCTIIYKLVQGVDQEPFPDGKFPVKPQAPERAAAAQFGIEMPWQSVLTSDIVRIVQVVPAGFADFMGNNAPVWLTVVGVVWSIAVWVLRHGYPTLPSLAWASFGAAAAQLLWIGPTVYFVLKSTSLGKDANKRGDAIDGVITAYGALMLVVGIALDIFTKAPLGQKIANILTPLPSLFCFLNMTQFRDSPDAPFAIAGNLLVDVVGYIGGGVELMLDTLQSKPHVAVA